MQLAEDSNEAQQVSVPEISCEVLICLFNELFVPRVQTCLCGGAEEPIYLLIGEARSLNEIHFTRDYCASAFHEIAHWCVAGVERLKQVTWVIGMRQMDEPKSSRANLRWLK